MPERHEIEPGAFYVGPLNADGKPHGTGKIIVEQSDHNTRLKIIDQIDGTFENGRIIGDAKIRFRMSFSGPYVGHVDERFVPRGPGVYTSSNGNKYSGEFFCDEPTFYFKDRGIHQRLAFRGTMEFFAIGYRAEGVFKDGLPDGDVIITTPEYTFRGVFKNPFGRHDGPTVVEGEYRYKDGRIYTGTMKRDDGGTRPLVNGKGKMEYPDGTVKMGTFRNGELLPEQVQSNYAGRLPDNVVCCANPHWIRFSPQFAIFIAAITVILVSGYRAEDLGGAAFDPIIVASIGVALAAVVWIMIKLFLDRFSFLAVTDQHIVHKTGILSQHTREVPLNSALAIDVNRSLLGRILGYGDVVIGYDGEMRAQARNIRNLSEFQAAAKRIAQ